MVDVFAGSTVVHFEVAVSSTEAAATKVQCFATQGAFA